MPRFHFRDEELQGLVDHLLTEDRIPDGAPVPQAAERLPIDAPLLEAVGSRLVTPDGFGCTSCHQVGKVLPSKAPLNARGPDLSQLGRRIRRSWFDRFVRNPARIVPRMEMPSVQIAVRGVVPENLDQQLSAVWEVLNRPGFQPPEPNPVRVVRHSGTRPADPPIVISDVLRTRSGTYIKPLLIGLSNRHNVLFDLETARFVNWSMGDTARQRTEGKTWYWEAAGKDILDAGLDGAELSFVRPGADAVPQVNGQFVTEFDMLERVANGLRFKYRLQYGEASRPVHVSQTWTSISNAKGNGFRREIALTGLSNREKVRLKILKTDALPMVERTAQGEAIHFREPSPMTIAVRRPADAVWETAGILAESENGSLTFELEYLTSLPVDRFLVDVPPSPPIQATSLQVVPGFSAMRLPLTDDVMPTALGWRPDGTLVIGSLKGQVWQATDTDQDGLSDRLTVLSDGLAAPYGLNVSADYVDVANKYAVLRLFDRDRDGSAEQAETLASGWGHTTDYHDWAVGLPRDEGGNYYLALPCQQDQRSKAAAQHRGEFLKLIPRTPTTDDPRRYSIETISRGHRFPMGIARRRDGELFVTDNQGNYNPFNELNHIQRGAHFGFINALEKGNGSPPPLTAPAINLPHPWVRSVNGICFLETPAARRQESGRTLFGPFEGHLIGCEYDTRRLIRMSLQKVGDGFQGAAYPFSYDQPPAGDPFLGPIVCEVSPDGDLYVGGLRDSGWGGANNIGEIVRLRMDPKRLPSGIAEMRATPGGFELDFIRPIDPGVAGDKANYSLSSYTRESTPAYGGPDLDHRTESITSVRVAKDGRRVTIHLAELRVGYVYELHVKPLVTGEAAFFPAEAHFTLAAIPKQ
jgi:hypothetical protein